MAVTSARPVLAAEPNHDPSSDQVRHLIETRLAAGIPLPEGGMLDAKRIAVGVRALPGLRFAVILSGVVDTTADRTAVVTFVTGIDSSLIPAADVDASRLGVTKVESSSDATQVINLLKIALVGEPVASYTPLDLPHGQHAVMICGTFSDQKKLASAKMKVTRVRLPVGWSATTNFAVPATVPDTTADDLKARISSAIATVGRGWADRIDVRVDPLGDNKFAAMLFNKDPATSARIPSPVAAKALAAAQAIPMGKNTITFGSQLREYPPISRTHSLKFLRDSLPNVVGKNLGEATPDISGTGTDVAATDLASFLSSLYSGSATISAYQNDLVIKGDAEQVQRIRQMLALYLDVPSPQVRADVITIQVNTRSSRPEAARDSLDKMDEIRAGVQVVRDFIQGAQTAINGYLVTHSCEIRYNLDKDPELKRLFRRAGVDLNPVRPLNVAEILTFLTFVDRSTLRTQLTPASSGPNAKTLAGQLEFDLIRADRLLSDEASHERAPTMDDNIRRHRPGVDKLIKRILKRIDADRSQCPARPVFDRVASLYPPETLQPHGMQADSNGFKIFLQAWEECARAFEDTNPYDPANRFNPYDPLVEELPNRLSIASATADLMLKQTMDAVTADLQELYIQPLLDWIREDVRGNDRTGSGVDLVGTTSIVVRDRTLAETSGSAESWYKFTPIPKLTESLLTDAKTLANGTAGTVDSTRQIVATDAKGQVIKDAKGDPVVLSNGQSLQFDSDGKVIRNADGSPVILSSPKASIPTTALGTLTPLDALGVKALFAADAAPFFKSVTPGISLAIRPFVLPDGGSARVQLNLVDTIDAQQPDSGKELQQGFPVDLIKNQSMTTEATISAFDLVEVSTFGAQTSAPGDYKWRVPVLDILPVVGGLFHGPQGRETHRQDSIALVNLTILPRSLDLVPYLRTHGLQ